MKTAEEVYLEHTGWESMEDIEDYDSPEDIILLMEKHAQQRVNEVLDKAVKEVYRCKKEITGWDNQKEYFNRGVEHSKNAILKLKNNGE